MEILVIGAGVSGLTSTLELLRAGHGVTVWARDLPPNTTSNAAAAVWMPYAVRGPSAGDVTRWGAISLERFGTLAGDERAGIVQREVLDLYPTAYDALPEWASAVPSFHLAAADELPPGYAMGYAFPAPVIDTSVYLNWLLDEVTSAGGRVERRAVERLEDVPARWQVVVNCTGLGARELAPDDRETSGDGLGVHAGRGQVVRVRNTGFARALADDADPQRPTYIVPRLRDIVLGGFNQASESLEPDPAQIPDILRRCAALAAHFDPAFAASLRALADPDSQPGVAPAEVVSVGVGLRPIRGVVRLEAQRLADGRRVVHNYGHGGAGVTLSWGCAEDVVRLVAENAS